MIRIFFLLSPIFVSLFWSIMLVGNSKVHGTPRLFLSKFMMITTLIFTAHFLYFAPVPEVYPYFDCALVYAGLLVYPLYYIYFRLLTIDKKFSLKAHFKYLIIPTFIFLLYFIVVLITPWEDYKSWLFKGVTSNATSKIQILQALRIVIIITFVSQLLISLIGNHRLIMKYGHNAEQFYSDIRDGKNKYSKILNFSILVMSLASLTAILLGRFFLMSKDVMISVVWSIFSASLFVMGNLGLKQKIINPAIDPTNERELLFQSFGLSTIEHSKLMDQIHEEFIIKKIYLNHNLIITDLVKTLGTNRSYISSAINQQYNQNFCSFTNGFRIEELKNTLQKNPEYSIVELAEICGFGSVNSMKRAVSAKTGLMFSDFKRQIHKDRKENPANTDKMQSLA